MVCVTVALTNEYCVCVIVSVDVRSCVAVDVVVAYWSVVVGNVTTMGRIVVVVEDDVTTFVVEMVVG